MKQLFFALTLLTAAFSIDATAGRYSNRVAQRASDYKANLEGNKLYGMTYSSPVTDNGRLACARVVQIVLKKAGV
ncbi:MAG: hypothetical protein KC493_01830, partial [Bacteriovoracaceae bacterium]|nr:hypothetical protein [Bacteriovoracaceae bacterium]